MREERQQAHYGASYLLRVRPTNRISSETGDGDKDMATTLPTRSVAVTSLPIALSVYADEVKDVLIASGTA